MCVVEVTIFHNEHEALRVEVEHPATMPAQSPLPQKDFSAGVVTYEHHTSVLRRVFSFGRW